VDAIEQLPALRDIGRHFFSLVFAIAGSIAYFGCIRTWTSVFVPAMYPPFADMRLIQEAVISVEHGLNPHF
jgi:hypothetical protein